MEIEKYLESSLAMTNTSSARNLFGGVAGEFIKNKYFNRSDDKEEYFEDLSDTLRNVTQLMEELGYTDIIGTKLW